VPKRAWDPRSRTPCGLRSGRPSDAWIDTEKRDPKDEQVGLVGYEINFNRYFYRYKPPRPLEEIQGEIPRVSRLQADLVLFPALSRQQ
jgi:hypothetical protein